MAVLASDTLLAEGPRGRPWRWLSGSIRGDHSIAEVVGAAWPWEAGSWHSLSQVLERASSAATIGAAAQQKGVALQASGPCCETESRRTVRTDFPQGSLSRALSIFVLGAHGRAAFI